MKPRLCPLEPSYRQCPFDLYLFSPVKSNIYGNLCPFPYGRKQRHFQLDEIAKGCPVTLLLRIEERFRTELLALARRWHISRDLIIVIKESQQYFVAVWKLVFGAILLTDEGELTKEIIL